MARTLLRAPPGRIRAGTRGLGESGRSGRIAGPSAPVRKLGRRRLRRRALTPAPRLAYLGAIPRGGGPVKVRSAVVVAVLTLGVLAAPLVVEAQQAARLYRIGV